MFNILYIKIIHTKPRNSIIFSFGYRNLYFIRNFIMPLSIKGYLFILIIIIKYFIIGDFFIYILENHFIGFNHIYP